VRVTVIHPGRTATPRQAAIHAHEGREYKPASLMQPEDVAIAIVSVLTLPYTAEITELTMRSMQAF
jgi:NADP-dependent 3-hydroxy acid dehydrogenase YdfG